MVGGNVTVSVLLADGGVLRTAHARWSRFKRRCVTTQMSEWFKRRHHSFIHSLPPPLFPLVSLCVFLSAFL